MAASMVHRLRFRFQQIEAFIFDFIGFNQHPGFGGALVVNSPVFTEPKQAEPSSLLESILGNGIFYAVPKHRRTVERRLTRKHAWSGKGRMREHQPKANLISCLECGHFHEMHTICGNCYEKVKKETKALQEAFGVERLKFKAPTSEVKFLYKDDSKDSELYREKYVVELEDERPQWFPRALLTKPSPK